MLSKKLIQTVIAYGAIVMAVLTQALAGVHLDPVASAVLGVFGILLHPGTSITTASVNAELTKELSAGEKAILKMVDGMLPKETPTP
jgi:uncharacterized membrane protein